jgi:membrane protein DedA with SNARE-associated domain
MLHDFLAWYTNSLDEGGYLLVALLMAMESSIVPLPSEVVIPPAAHLAYTRGNMTLAGVVLAGTLGSWVGASLMYWASRVLGRPLLMRYGRWVMITPAKIEAAEKWSAQFGTVGVFISRLLPVIRHLIGIPAGIVRLDFRWYSLATLAGSFLWCCVLAWVGVKAGQNEALMRGDLHALTLWLGGGSLVLGAIYWFFVHRHMK